MSRDSQGNPFQPHCVPVSWLIFMCRPEYLLVCSLCRKNLGLRIRACPQRKVFRRAYSQNGGIASAGAAGLEELTQYFSRQGKPSIRFLFQARRAFSLIPFPGKESPRFSSFFRQGEPSFT